MRSNCDNQVSAQRRGTKGFTLIELLVVIVIIMILASILFPVFISSRERARTASCTSNMRQIGIAVRMYANEYDGYLGAYDYNWERSIERYLRNRDIFTCPSKMTGVPCSYGANWWAMWGPPPDGHTRLDKVPTRPIPGDPNWGKWTDIYVCDEWEGYGWDKNGNGVADCYERHLKGSNILLSDGSVKFIKKFRFPGLPLGGI